MSQSDRAGERQTAVVVVKETAAQRSHDPSAFVARPRFARLQEGEPGRGLFLLLILT